MHKLKFKSKKSSFESKLNNPHRGHDAGNVNGPAGNDSQISKLGRVESMNPPMSKRE